MSKKIILVVDDEPGMRQYLNKLLSDNKYKVLLAENGKEALDAVQVQKPELVLADLKMPKMDGIELLDKIKKISSSTPVIMMTAFGTMETAVQAMKMGAADFVNKPFDIDQILLVIKNALERVQLKEENIVLRQQLTKSYSFEDVVSQNEQMHKIFAIIKNIAPTRSHVLIQGETGTGKEMIARAIHNLSPQCDHPFIPVDCGALTESILESELFGHIKGAFTGATEDKKGLFEIAHRGTAFLDEIGKTSLRTQSKLLRVLQNSEIKRVGEASSRHIDVRLIAASNENLQKSIVSGNFREDLFYRLNVILIELPPLRDRKEDIPLLIEHFLMKYNRLERRNLKNISKDSLNILMNYDWPGNIRELENIIHRAVVMKIDDIIEPNDLPATLHHLTFSAERRKRPTRDRDFSKARKTFIELFEKDFIVSSLKDHKGNVSRMAKAIRLDRRNLQRKFKMYGINPGDYHA